jgi:hypothetical protein
MINKYNKIIIVIFSVFVPYRLKNINAKAQRKYNINF